MTIAQDPAIQDFLDRRFGLFIHWGVYSRLGGKWNGRDVGSDLGEWIMNCLQIPIAEYEKIAAGFNPSAFDADALVRLAADAGMRYVVLTSKHHDGFAMFHSKSDRYNIVDWTGGKRDVCAELAEACRKYGLKLGFYYSQALDWHEEHAGGWNVPPYGLRQSWGNVWDFPDNTEKNFEQYFRKKALPQVAELLTQYGDIQLIWFDTPRTINPQQSRELYELVKRLQPACLVNSRIGNECGDYNSLGDNQIPAAVMDRPTESPVTLNDTWGYKEYDSNWKAPEELVEMLGKVASRNVNLLLNIGPRGDGSLTDDTVRILRRLAVWNLQYGDAIHGTRGNPMPGGLPWAYLTTGAREIYLMLRNAAARTVRLNGLKSSVTEVRCGDRKIPFHQEKAVETGFHSLRLELPALAAPLPVLTVACGEAPRFDTRLQVQDGVLRMPVLASRLTDGRVKDAASVIMPRLYEELPEDRKAYYEAFGQLRISPAGLLVGWTRAKDSVEWTVCFEEPGLFHVELVRWKEGGADSLYGGRVHVDVSSGETASFPLAEDAVYSESRSNPHDNQRILSRGGPIRMTTPGERTIRVRLDRDTASPEREIALVEMRLVRVPAP